VISRYSLRFKVAVAFSTLTVLLLVSQALAVKTFAEVQEEQFITALIADDMRNLLQTWRADPALLPPRDLRLDGRLAENGQTHVALPSAVKQLSPGTHEIVLNGREIHVVVALFGTERVYRAYDFSTYERHFKRAIAALMVATGVFALLTIWLAYGFAGLLVHQIAGFARQVTALKHGMSPALVPGRYDEAEVVALVDAFNDYHRRMRQMIEREKEFTGNVSHELRTPLTTIKTSCELLEQDATINPKSRERLHRIGRATDQMIGLVGALLLLAREESAIETGTIRLGAVVQDVLEPFVAALADKGINLQFEIDACLQVVANLSALEIVLSNLIDNAVRHTERGYLRVTWENGWLLIEDSGCGIPSNALPHVFDRFYRVDTNPLPSEGFGIGLAVVKKICDRYQWLIEIKSETDIGTRVLLRLPAIDRDIQSFTTN
jgi:signal transduction histidine kinase